MNSAGAGGYFLGGGTRGVAAGGQVQRGTINVPVATGSTTTGNLTVLNSAFVRLRLVGQSWPTIGANTTCPSARVSLNIVNGTTVTITATKTANDWSATVEYELTDLDPGSMFQSPQRGTITSGTSPVTITAVNNTATAEVDWLGTSGGGNLVAGGSLALTSTTQITLTVTDSATIGYQVLDWKR